MLSEDELREAVVLVFANKQDLPNAMSVAEVTARSPSLTPHLRKSKRAAALLVRLCVGYVDV